MKRRIAIFASGSGSNAQNIVAYFTNSTQASVALILTNNPKAYVLQRAHRLKVPSYIFNKQDLYESNALVQVLRQFQITFIVLAGFLWLLPPSLLKAFPNKIINIHPSLLPKYRGKGMYGDHVYRAIVAAHERESGITIHFVNENFDEGAIIYQASFPIQPSDDLHKIKMQTQQLEHLYYPKVIASVLNSQP